MVIECSATNFKSLKKEQVFRLYTDSSSDHLDGNVHRSPSRKFGILRSCGIYGANASGKSNVLEVFRAIRYLACSSGHLTVEDAIPCYNPYKLDEFCRNSPTLLDIEFEIKGIRYIYSIEFDAFQIQKESLIFYPSGKPATLFERLGNDWQNVKFGSSLKGGKRKYEFFANNSYLSKAGTSAGSPQLIRDVYKFFYRDIDFVGVDHAVYLSGWTKDEKMVANVSEILSAIDTGIKGLQFEEEDVEKMKSLLPSEMPEGAKEHFLEPHKHKAFFLHEDEQGEMVKFEDSDISDGSRALFKSLPIILDVLRRGGVILFDELQGTLHPHIAELFIKIFNNPSVNVNSAQLIYTTHDTSLMGSEFLRREQIWFCQKTNKETSLYALDDFDKKSVTPKTAFADWYNDGRFKGIPNINHRLLNSVILKVLDRDKLDAQTKEK